MDKKTRAYDFVLTIITVFVFVAIGVVCAYGTVFSYFMSKADPNWTGATGYGAYLSRMNALSFPLFIGLLVLLALCIPKRIIAKYFLYLSTALMLIIAILTGTLYDPVRGLGLMLIFTMIVQCYVILRIIRGSQGLLFQKKGKIARLGSGILHLGMILFLYDLIILDKSPLHILVFWIAAAMISIGNILVFYPNLFTIRKKAINELPLTSNI